MKQDGIFLDGVHCDSGECTKPGRCFSCGIVRRLPTVSVARLRCIWCSWFTNNVQQEDLCESCLLYFKLLQTRHQHTAPRNIPTTNNMQYTTLFAALSLLASSPLTTAYPHNGDHVPSVMSRGYAGYEVSASIPNSKPTGSPHPPGCTCSHCNPHKPSPYGNSTSISVLPKHNCTTSTMVDEPAHTSFLPEIHARRTETVVVTSTMFDEPAYSLFSSGTGPTPTLPAMVVAANSASSSTPDVQAAEDRYDGGVGVADNKLAIGLAVGMLVIAILMFVAVFWLRSRGWGIHKWGRGWT
jgi:hypothetical protein